MRKLVCYIAAFLLATALSAQDKQLMTDYQSQLTSLFEQVYNAPTDNQRYHANEAALQLLLQALAEDNSFRWQWDFGNRVSVLTAPDKKFRIFTWPVVNDGGEYECFGIVQALNEKSDSYDVYVLNDKSDLIVNRQESLLAPDNWFGAVYQELITTSYEGKNYYTLLGWNGVDNLTQRKIIEPICFKSGGSMPQFGQNLFRKERNVRRVVLEYTHNAMVNLRYEEQTVRTVEHIRAKRKGRSSAPAYSRTPSRRGKKGRGRQRRSRVVETASRTSSAMRERVSSRPTEKITDKKMRMIIFDEVDAQIVGMEGLYQYYVPTGTELAYLFVDGKWELRQGAQGRVTDKRLNQDFDKPMQKQRPAYQVIDN
ncbi:MAG: hypothetical protein IJK84_09415 [Bacteroidales bacterium]|nr:hypothetical protein [Bacteroidales bacterium]